jgi:apoptosis-inducing factor 3
MKEIAVAQVNDLQNGQMQQIAVADSEILLTKIDDRFYATGAFCPHNGAPLAKGILSQARIVCPWHNACFNAIAGQQQEPPGLDSLATFVTRIEGDRVLVELPEEISQHRTLEMAQYVKESDDRTLVVLGAGAAGLHAVEAIRQQGFQGKLILISAEAQLPYDRTKLSKDYLQGKAKEDSLSLRSCEFYAQHDIELRFGQTVTKVDAANKFLTFADGSSLEYDSLLLATGGKARKLEIKGADLANIFTLRRTEDVNSILAVAKNAQKALIVGSSFIGMEAAASLIQQGLEVTVVSPSDVPFKKILGDELGKMLQKLHEKNGVSFKLGTKTTEFRGEGKVESAVLEDGTTISTDLVIVGVGVEPNTDYIEGIKLNEKDRSVPVNEYLATARENIYAAGDIARFPYAPMSNTRIEHWRLAAQQGRIAATNMLNKSSRQTTSTIVPFFWSGQYDLKLRYVGHAEKWDKVYIDGDLNQPKFLAFYFSDRQVMAVAGVNRDQEIAAISELMRQQKMPDTADIQNQQIDWLNIL